MCALRKSILILSLAILSLSSYASQKEDDNDHSDDGINVAAKACDKLFSDSDKKDCLASVGSAYYFSEDALNVCSKLYSDSSKKGCIKKIADKDIRKFEAEACGKMYNESDRTSCLFSVKREAQRNRSVDGHSDGLDLAANTCSSLYGDSDKKECLSFVGSAFYFSEDALNVCSKLYNDSSKKGCIKKIADKDIRSFEAETCGKMYNESDRTSCLFSIKREASRDRRDDGHSDGIDLAANTCGSLYNDSDKKECLSSVGSAFYFSEDALNVCGKLYNDSNKKACIKGIVDKDIRKFEAETCGKMYNESNITSCLLSIKRKAQKERSSDGYSDGLDSAANACDSLYSDSQKKECLSSVGSAYYFSEDALNVCSKLYNDSSKKDCIKEIANKDILQAGAEACGEKHYESDRISCMASLGRAAKEHR